MMGVPTLRFHKFSKHPQSPDMFFLGNMMHELAILSTVGPLSKRLDWRPERGAPSENAQASINDSSAACHAHLPTVRVDHW